MQSAGFEEAFAERIEDMLDAPITVALALQGAGSSPRSGEVIA